MKTYNSLSLLGKDIYCGMTWNSCWQKYTYCTKLVRNVTRVRIHCEQTSFSNWKLLSLSAQSQLAILTGHIKRAVNKLYFTVKDGRQTQWWPRHKAIYFSWFGPELFCLLLGPPGFYYWFSSAPVFQWCCSTPQGSLGVGRNTFLSSPHLCFIIVFICDLFVSRDDPLMS